MTLDARVVAQRRHELDRAYDAAESLARSLVTAHEFAQSLSSRLELAGLDELAADARRIRSAVYGEMLKLDAAARAAAADPVPQSMLADRRSGFDRRREARGSDRRADRRPALVA